MDFEEFKKQLMEDLKAYLPTEIGTGVEVEANEVQKVQNAGYEGIVVKKENDPVGVNMDAEKLYSDFQQGKTYEDIFHYAVDVVQKGFDNAPSVDVDKIMDYERMRDSLFVQLIPIAGNEDILADLPHKEVEDLACVYRFAVGKDENGMASILIKNNLLDRYGVTTEQLHEDAMKSAPFVEPANIRSLTDVLKDMMGQEFVDAMDGVPMGDMDVYVATNQSMMNGASVIMYPGFLDEAAEKMGGSFYDIPSSVHEHIFYPDNGSMDAKTLAAMVHEVNETQVAPADRLSDNVYHYDAEEKIFELADKYEERVAEKEVTMEEKGSVLKDLDKKSKEVSEKAPTAPKKNRAEEVL